MGMIFDSKTNIFKKNKALMTDGCCDEALPCCGDNTQPKGYKLQYVGDTTFDITGNFTTNQGNNKKWSIILIDDLDGTDINITGINITPSIPAGLSVLSPLPVTVSDGDNVTIVGATWDTGLRAFTIELLTDQGNFTFKAEINVI